MIRNIVFDKIFLHWGQNLYFLFNQSIKMLYENG